MQKVVLALVLLGLMTIASAAPLLNAHAPGRIPDTYMVVFNPSTSITDRDSHVNQIRQRMRMRNTEVAEEVINVFAIEDVIGYSAKLAKVTLFEELSHPMVKHVEVDQYVHLVDEAHAEDDDILTQTGATWGINRVWQRKLV